jgi:hypothetical protein
MKKKIMDKLGLIFAVLGVIALFTWLIGFAIWTDNGNEQLRKDKLKECIDIIQDKNKCYDLWR